MALSEKQRAIDFHDEQAQAFHRRYERFRSDPYHSAFTYGRLKVEAVLDDHLGAPGQQRRLLDAGCGPGYLLRTYAARGYQCVGIDASPSMVEVARHSDPPLDVCLADVERLPFDSASFDYLLSVEVIRYLPDCRPCIHEFSRVLRPGGVALVTAMPPYTLTAYPLVNYVTSTVRVGNLSRLRQFFHSVRGLERTFRECGFSRVEVRGAFWGPFVNIERLAPRMLPRLLAAWEPIDDALSRIPLLRDFSNHLVVIATR